MRSEPTKQRSQNMRAIKASSNATTERRFRAHLMRSGASGWRVCVRELPGMPDFYFDHQRLAVFIDGCFWHGCPRCGHIPKTNRPYWVKKLARNRRRDIQVRSALRAKRIRVMRIWECRLRDEPASCMARLSAVLARSPIALFRRR